jgi:hypothetical protein
MAASGVTRHCGIVIDNHRATGNNSLVFCFGLNEIEKKEFLLALA